MTSITVVYSQSPSRKEFYAFALKAQVTSAVGMSPAVFMFQRPAGRAECAKDNYVCVADPQDLEEIPENVPNLEDEQPYYRLAEITLYFRNTEDRDACQEWLKSDIQQLVTSLNALSTLTPTETETVTAQ